MTAITKLYRVQVYEAGSTSMVDFTWDSQLGAVPIVGTQRARPLEGRVDSRPWTLEVADIDGAVTSQLADAGRANLLGRLVAVQVNIDSGGWTTIAKGRIANLSESQPGSYKVQVSDERVVERSNMIFTTTDTCRVYPAGLKTRWFDINPVNEPTDWTVSDLDGDDVLLAVGGSLISSNIISLFQTDLKENWNPGASSGGVGNFRLLRAQLNGTDREVLRFR